MSLKITPVSTKKQQRDFYRFAQKVYQDDPYWVPPLWPQRRAYLRKEVPFFTYGEGDFFILEADGEIAGTFGLGIDHPANEADGDQSAVFGFFEVYPEYRYAAAIWDFAADWARAHGMTKLKGPYSFSTNEYGFLVDGFDNMPAVMMTHNPPCYPIFAEKYGFEEDLEKLAYRLDLGLYDHRVENAPDILFKIVERAEKRHGKRLIRKGREEIWPEEVRRIHPLYNKALSQLDDFTPIELVEFEAQAGALKPILDPELVLIAEMEGEVIGLLMGIPNVAEAFKYANGLQYPWDYLKFYRARKKITGVTLKIMAIDPNFWGYGLDAMMFLQIGETLIRKGYTWIDASLTSAGNPFTNKLAKKLGAEIYRRYKTYQLRL